MSKKHQTPAAKPPTQADDIRKLWLQVTIVIGGIAAAAVTGYFGYLTVVGPIREAARLTQTAEARQVAAADSPSPIASITPTPTATPSPTPTPTATSTPTPCVLYENFESTVRMIWWSPNPEVFSFAYMSEQAHSGNRSMKITYNKTDAYQFVGAEPPVEMRDFSLAQAVEVWVYGQADILLKLADENGNEADVSTLNAVNLTAWDQLRFDYSQAAASVDLTHVKNLLFFPALGDPAASGVIYFDDIALCRQP